jgi:ABC-type polysaccharide/polyol phosphate export permease
VPWLAAGGAGWVLAQRGRSRGAGGESAGMQALRKAVTFTLGGVALFVSVAQWFHKIVGGLVLMGAVACFISGNAPRGWDLLLMAVAAGIIWLILAVVNLGVAALATRVQPEEA